MKVITSYDINETGITYMGKVSLKGTSIITTINGYGLFDVNNDRLIFTDTIKEIFSPSISPCGNYGFAYSQKDNSGELTMYNVTNEGLNKLWRLPSGNINSADWFPDTTFVMYIIYGGEYNGVPRDKSYNVQLFTPESNVTYSNFDTKHGLFNSIDTQ